jgi:hypothetical protein
MQQTIPGQRVCECLPELINYLHAAESFVPQLGKGKYPLVTNQIFRISHSERSTSRAY